MGPEPRASDGPALSRNNALGLETEAKWRKVNADRKFWECTPGPKWAQLLRRPQEKKGKGEDTDLARGQAWHRVPSDGYPTEHHLHFTSKPGVEA